jgi:hypothetical protein
MTSDPNSPDVLLSVSSEIEAAAIVTALAEYDIKAISVGGYTSGFKAEAPGVVAIVVKLADFDRAKQALTEIRQQQAQIDWSKVDVTETPEEAHIAVPEAGSHASAQSSILGHVWWLVELIGVAICFIIWLFTRQLTPMLVYAVTALAILGLFLALSPFARRGR